MGLIKDALGGPVCIIFKRPFYKLLLDRIPEMELAEADAAGTVDFSRQYNEAII